MSGSSVPDTECGARGQVLSRTLYVRCEEISPEICLDKYILKVYFLTGNREA